MNTPIGEEEFTHQRKQKRHRKIYVISFLTVMSIIGIGTWIWEIKGGSYHFFVLILIGLGASFLGTLAGGAGLITIPGMMLTGIPIQTSIATNKFSSGIAAFSSVFYLIRHKELSIRSIMSNLLVAFLGGMGGSLLTSHIHEKTMNIVAFLLLNLALIVTLINKKWTANIQFNQQPLTYKMNLYIPLFVAAYDGGFGPGSSTFSIIYYMKNSHTYMKAVQMTRVLILGSCAGGFIVFFQTGFIIWSYAISMAIGSIIGSQIGLLLLPKIPQKIAENLLLIIICLLIIQMIYKLK
ncbi:TSUP family transporter [Virgibacillus sp. AGTR]|uniref:sulfite exporter TauE/SafE family protein n=1 Tax=Virgibacillus sp. AGTR TaxID=2812055 RepID=UPI001D040C25|nr:TSUP family transporter [Virgibacillus sp. AGTR]MCC2249710.1 TSUP family transporter [Virgibacillus sp. AGTR]